MGSVAIIAWFGMYVHNVADLPGLTILSPENAGPTLVWVAVFAVWWLLPDRRWPTVAILAWGWVNLIGGALSVLPIGLSPFSPEQTMYHYSFHGLYAACQVPLLRVGHAQLRARHAA